MRKEIPRMDTVWGWRAVLGFICPSLYGSAPDRGIYEVAPEGVAILTASLGINVVCEDNLEDALTRVEPAAKLLVMGGVDFIHLAGPFGFLHGLDRDRALIKRLEEVTKVPVSTGIGGMFNALQTLGVKKLCHVHAGQFRGTYESLVKKVYKDNGIEVVNFKGLEGPATNNDVRRLPLGVPFQLARKAYLEAPQADAVYIDCGAWTAPVLVDYLEQELGKPVITHPAIFLWTALKALKIRAPVKGYGRLFETLL